MYLFKIINVKTNIFKHKILFLFIYILTKKDIHFIGMRVLYLYKTIMYDFYFYTLKK